jgi:hypothetical protein|tara:strand:+ start:1181 stop:1405 length:225 start_codon:yes stop_codon:yes gene_type:complete
MYRIIKETNRLTDTVRFIIERKKTFLWTTSWTTELGLRDVNQNGPIGAPTYDGARIKLQEIMAWDGTMLKREVI